MAAEQAGGNGANVAPGGREHGNGHTQGAFAVAAQIVHSGNAGDVSAFALVKRHIVCGCHS